VAKADKSDTSTEEEKAVEAKISDDVVDAEIIEDTSGDGQADESVDDSSDEITEEAAENTSDTSDEDVSDLDSAEDGSDLEEASDDVTDNEAVSDEPPEDTDTAPSETEVPEDAPVTPQATVEPVVKKTGFMQVALGGVIAAGLGFGLSQYVGPLSAEKDPALVELEAVVAAQSEQIAQLLAGQTETQTAMSAAQDALTAASGNVDGLTGAVAAVNGRIDDAAGALAILDGRIAAIEKQPITQSLPSSAIEAYEREVEELKAAVASQRAEAASMEENAKLTAQQALARAALSRVLSALDSGAGYRVALTDFSAATGTASPAELEAFADTGVTSLAALQNEFPDAARARSGEQTDGNKLTSFFKAQLGARSVTPQEGDGADAVLSRAEAALRAGRVSDTLAELATLPEAAQPAFDGWVAKANARQAAFAAGEALSQQLNSN